MLCLLFAAVGSGLFVFGISKYAGGLDFTEEDPTTMIYGIMALILTVIGFLYQRCSLYAGLPER